MSLMNRLANCRNQFQGKAKRVLCVCSAGLLRSPTAAEVLRREPFNFNTRAAGLVKDFALIPVDAVLLAWADEIVCMTPEQATELENRTEKSKPIICLDIDDNFGFRDPMLEKIIQEKYLELSKLVE